MWCVYSIAVGAIYVPVGGCINTIAAIDDITVAGWAHDCGKEDILKSGGLDLMWRKLKTQVYYDRYMSVH